MNDGTTDTVGEITTNHACVLVNCRFPMACQNTSPMYFFYCILLLLFDSKMVSHTRTQANSV